MSVWTNLFHWAQNSGVLATAQKAAAAEAASYIDKALSKAVGHAPDMRQELERNAADFLKTTLVGLSTQNK